MRYGDAVTLTNDAPVVDRASGLVGELRQSLAQTQGTPVSASEAEPRSRAALAVIATGIAGFTGILALVRRNRLDAIDLAATMRLQAIRHPLLERAMAVVSWFGFPPQSRILPPITIAALWLGRFRLEAAFQLAAWGSALISTVVKTFMKRPRPVAGIDLRVVTAELGGSSFPSGHVLTYVGTYGWLAVLASILIRPRSLRGVAVAALTALIAGVGPSRIYLGHHWLSDVTASYLLGSSYLALLVLAYRRLKARHTLQ